MACVFCGELFSSRSEETAHVCANQPSRVVRNGSTQSELSASKKTMLCGELFSSRSDETAHVCANQPSRMVRNGSTQSELSASKKASCSTIRKKVGISLKDGLLQLKATFHCDSCGCEFPTRRDLEKHKAMECDKKSLAKVANIEDSSSFCDTLRGDDEVYASDHGDVSLLCDVCGAVFSDREGCRRHIIEDHLEPSDCSNRKFDDHLIKALESGKEAEIRSYASDLEESDDQKYPCTLCQDQFGLQLDLFEHMASVHNKRVLYECSICGKMFVQRLALTRHFQGHAAASLKTASSSARRPRYECRFCGKQFLFVSYLRRHVATHTAECYYMCDICGDQFRSQGRLVLHKAEHTGQQLYSCPKCGKTFPYRSYLERHYRTHVSNPSQCPHCDRIFTIPSQLEKHIAVEHEEGGSTLSCPHCDRKFQYPSYLERHLATHLQNGEHACPICQRNFTVRGALLSHLQRHLPLSAVQHVYPYKCRFCVNSYRRESYLEKHVQQVHGLSCAYTSTL